MQRFKFRYYDNLVSSTYWSSSEYSSGSARFVYLSSGNVGNSRKDGAYYVRAFALV